MNNLWVQILAVGVICSFSFNVASGALTMKQFQASMDMMRDGCINKIKVSPELVEGLKTGGFVDDKKLKCYTHCIAQVGGVLTKKGEISESKMAAQFDTMIPDSMKEHGRAAMKACKGSQNNGSKDVCDKVFAFTKCTYDVDPSKFMFP